MNSDPRVGSPNIVTRHDKSPAKETVARLGAAAIIGNPDFVRTDLMPGGHELEPIEQQVLFLASLGGTVENVARALATGEQTVRDSREAVMFKFEGRDMAATVDQAICTGVLPVKVKSNPDIKERLSDREIYILKMFRTGLSNQEIATKLDKAPSTVATLNRDIFKKIGASGRTHSVRRCYELGIFETGC